MAGPGQASAQQQEAGSGSKGQQQRQAQRDVGTRGQPEGKEVEATVAKVWVPNGYVLRWVDGVYPHVACGVEVMGGQGSVVMQGQSQAAWGGARGHCWGQFTKSQLAGKM